MEVSDYLELEAKLRLLAVNARLAVSAAQTLKSALLARYLREVFASTSELQRFVDKHGLLDVPEPPPPPHAAR